MRISKSLRVLVVTAMLVTGAAFTGVMPASAYYAMNPINITQESAPQNYADIDGTIAVWRDGRDGTCGAWDIWMYDFATGEQKPVTTEDKKQEYPRIEGDYIVYQSDQDCEGWPNNSNIYLYDLALEEATVVCENDADQEMPDVSGEVIVWSEYDYWGSTNNWDIYGYDMATETDMEICDADNWQGDVRVDGDVIVWADNRDDNTDVYMYDLSTDTESEVCTETSDQRDPVVEGDTIAWLDDRDGHDAVYAYDIPTGVESEICTSTGSLRDLEIGDGVLVWNDDATGDGDVYAYDLATDTLTQVTDVAECDGMPAISNGMIVYNHYMPGPGEPDIWAVAMEQIPVDYVGLAGPTRYETAVEVSKGTYPGGADTVIIATGSNWPDALGASALAGVYDAPILLTETDELPDVVAAEIVRLGAMDAFVIGGTAAVSSSVLLELRRLLSGEVVRLGGLDRYETAQIVASETVAANPEWDGTAFVTTGLNFPDALSASPLAAKAGWPIFLSGLEGVSDGTQAAIEEIGVSRLLLLGGTGVVPASVSIQADNVGVASTERIGGMNRYATAVALATYGAENLGMKWNRPALTTGENFPDALSAGVAQGRTGNLILLTPPTYLDSTTASAIAAHRFLIWGFRYIGGTKAISAEVRAEVAMLLP